MKLTLLGSLGHINQYTIPAFVKAGHDVTVVTSSEKRVAAIESIGAHAAVGSMKDTEFLTSALTGADAAYLMLSGGFDDSASMDETATKQAIIFRDAVRDAGVNRIVNLSSVGADQGPEVGSLHMYHIIEDTLRELENVNITFVRAVGFYSNWLANIPTIKSDHAIYRNAHAQTVNAMTDPSDIATAIIEELQNLKSTTDVRYVVSDFQTGNQIIETLSKRLNIPDLKWVELTDQQMMTQMEKMGMPTPFAQGMTTSNRRQDSPDFYADLRANLPALGKIKFSDFAERFVSAYQNS